MRQHIMLTSRQVLNVLQKCDKPLECIRVQDNTKQEYQLQARGKFILTSTKATKPRAHSIESFINKFPQDSGAWVFGTFVAHRAV